MKHWSPQQLTILRRLREGFLSGTTDRPDYWRSVEEVALYDQTFGARIGWKWDAVLRELLLRNWQPQSRHLFEWGCGSAVGSRRVLAAWKHFDTVLLHDRSAVAAHFAAERVQHENPPTKVRIGETPIDDTLLVVSHVLNELPTSARASLLTLARQAREMIWVEAGTHANSRALIEVREELLGVRRSDGTAQFSVVAPCTHQGRCGMLAPENSRHWCHQFARVPSVVFQDARWQEFARELGVDLRSLPLCFLVLQRAKSSDPVPAGFSRVIGAPRNYKGYSKVLSSQLEGVAEFMLQRRDAPELLRELRTGSDVPVYRWRLEGKKIIAGERVGRIPAGQADERHKP